LTPSLWNRVRTRVRVHAAPPDHRRPQQISRTGTQPHTPTHTTRFQTKWGSKWGSNGDGAMTLQPTAPDKTSVCETEFVKLSL